ncbi:MAG: hypothetical protein IKO42_04820 [Opitutales bacterium]|nr:hypothetical protein [Opitutales bacterium]
MRRYAEHFEKLYQFREYGDFQNYFIALGYVCPAHEFVSRRGAPLTNIVAANGRPIFKNNNINLSRYKLLAEEFTEPEGGLLKVKEIYGYAPDAVYETYTAEAVQSYGLEDPSGYLKASVSFNSGAAYDAIEDTFTIYLTSVSGLVVGNMVKPSLDYVRFNYGGSIGYRDLYRAEAPSVPILTINSTANSITCRAYEYTFYDLAGNPTGNYPKEASIRLLRPYPGGTSEAGLRPAWLTREFTTRTPTMVIANVANVISYHTEFPQLDERFIATNGEGETLTINSSTTPSISTWNEWIAANRRVNIQDAVVEIVYPQALYRKVVKQTQAR